MECYNLSWSEAKFVVSRKRRHEFTREQRSYGIALHATRILTQVICCSLPLWRIPNLLVTWKIVTWWIFFDCMLRCKQFWYSLIGKIGHRNILCRLVRKLFLAGTSGHSNFLLSRYASRHFGCGIGHTFDQNSIITYHKLFKFENNKRMNIERHHFVWYHFMIVPHREISILENCIFLCIFRAGIAIACNYTHTVVYSTFTTRTMSYSQSSLIHNDSLVYDKLKHL